MKEGVEEEQEWLSVHSEDVDFVGEAGPRELLLHSLLLPLAPGAAAHLTPHNAATSALRLRADCPELRDSLAALLIRVPPSSLSSPALMSGGSRAVHGADEPAGGDGGGGGERGGAGDGAARDGGPHAPGLDIQGRQTARLPVPTGLSLWLGLPFFKRINK